MATKVKVFCEVFADQLEKRINEWAESGEAGVIHWNCMRLCALADSGRGTIDSAYGVVIPYEPKTAGR